MTQTPLTDLLDTAIRREQEAHRFYTTLAGRIQDPGTREAIAFIAEEERRHETFLKDYKSGKLGAGALGMRRAIHYKVAEYLDEPELSETLSRPDVFLVAAHRESRATLFYTELAALHEDGEMKTMVLKMASEELKHKEKMEYLYANAAFPQTDGG